ncbi:hypothetical protein ASZ78_003869 [Callipepla squamata]|uniref:EML-like second beta-propeller domain-containing protein n=1 Tax=Callipepla squamata TaxID=9009 RepID=A0A226N4L2_CALSU|nr:hypothetical protein ASZ78_003869 [Callipepla squamata]
MEDGFSSYSSLYDTSSLLQFCNVVDPEETVYAYLTNIYHTKLKSPSVFSDDSASAASSMEVTDRIASLEQRVQMQEDDIQLLKSALADVVRRLNITEEQQAMQNKKGPTKDQSMIKKAAAEAGKHVSAATTARPLVQTLPLRTTVNNGTVLPKKPSGSLPSPSGTRKETVPPAAKSYGYRGRDCRSNLYLLPTGETVYFIASVVVLFNVEEQLQRHYTGHNDDVKCLAVHPDRITIATGQVAGTSKDGKIPEQFGPIRTVAEGKGDVVLIGTTRNFVLQGTLSGDFFPITQGHTDELWGLAVHSSKPQFFTCGHDKHITLWDAMTHRPIWNKIIEDPAQSSGFHPSAAVVAVGTLTGRWFVFDTETKDLVTVHTDGNEQLSVMRYSPDGNFLAIGSHDNSIYIYGVNENGRKYTRIGKCSGHSSFITHLDWSVNSQYLVSNSGDYEILYWIPSACKQVVSVETTRDIEWATYTCTLGFHVFGVWPEGSDGTDINAVCRSHGRKLLSTGDDFGKVHLFSYPCSQFRAPSHVYGGHSSHVTNVDFLCEDTHLISTGGKDTSIMQWRVI